MKSSHRVISSVDLGRLELLLGAAGDAAEALGSVFFCLVVFERAMVNRMMGEV